MHNRFTGELLNTRIGNPGDRLGDRFSISNDGLLAIRRRDGVEVLDMKTDKVVGQTIPSIGKTVMLQGNTLIVSEEGPDAPNGRVRIFSLDSAGPNTTWTEDTVLEAPVDGGRFGWMVDQSCDGTKLVVSAPNTTVIRNSSSPVPSTSTLLQAGSVFVYQKQTTTSQWHLLSSLHGAAAGDKFGFSMAMSCDGSVLAVGSPTSNGNGNGRGSVSIYRRNTSNSSTDTAVTTDSQEKKKEEEEEKTNNSNFSNKNEKILMATGSFSLVEDSPISGTNDGDRLGRTVAVSSDGHRVVAASYLHNQQRGQIIVFDYIPSTERYVVAITIVGDEVQDRLGFGVEGVIFSPDNDYELYAAALWAGGQGSFSGQVDTFPLPILMPGPISATPSFSLVPSIGPTPIMTSFVPSTVPSVRPTIRTSQPTALEATQIPSKNPSPAPLSPSPTSKVSLIILQPTAQPTFSSNGLDGSQPNNSGASHLLVRPVAMIATSLGLIGSTILALL